MSGNTGNGADDQKDGGGLEPSPEELARKCEDKALRARLNKLSESLEARKQADMQRERAARGVEVPGGATGRALNLGFRILSEFIAGIIAGGAIGWLLDKWLSTSPVFLLIFGVLGTVAGFWNVYRVAMNPTGARQDRDGK